VVLDKAVVWMAIWSGTQVHRALPLRVDCPTDRGMEERHAWTLDQAMHAGASCWRDRFSQQEKCVAVNRTCAYKKE
jgi:hypothetical protein